MKSPTVVPPRRTVPRPQRLQKQEDHRSPTPHSHSPSPDRELSPTFSIIDGHEGDGSFSGEVPSCVKLAPLNGTSIEWDRLRQILAPHRGHDHRPQSRGEGSIDAGVRSATRQSDCTGLSELLSQPYVDSPPLPSPKPWIRPSNHFSEHTSSGSTHSVPEDDPDEAELPDPDADLPPETYYEVAYIPHGKYAWAAGQPAGKLRPLANLEGEYCNAMLI